MTKQQHQLAVATYSCWDALFSKQAYPGFPSNNIPELSAKESFISTPSQPPEGTLSPAWFCLSTPHLPPVFMCTEQLPGQLL